MTVAIVDYGSGNLHSAAKAFERAAREGAQDEDIMVTSDRDVVSRADRVVLAGVGAWADCRRGLDAVDGMIAAMQEAVVVKGRPFLGICVGMQLMATRGLEYETSVGLDWIHGDVTAIRPDDPGLKIPHMGWNTLHPQRDHPLLEGIPTGPEGLHAYFVHYGGAVSAIVARENMAGTQFHPEKSQMLGLALIGNFLRWRP